MTTVYVTHDQKEALTMSDRIAVINDGELKQLGSPNEIYTNPSNAFIADFIGESSLLPTKVIDNKAYLGQSELLVNKSLTRDGEFLLVIRPEKLFIAGGKEKDSNIFSGVIEESIFQGESQLVVIKLDPDNFGDQLLRMRLPNGTSVGPNVPKVGEEISVGLRMTDSFLVE
tara:strand:- start:154 stop:666 length:513 start_codon:yes stop_codon:yes gene_type:complete